MKADYFQLPQQYFDEFRTKIVTPMFTIAQNLKIDTRAFSPDANSIFSPL